MNWCRVSSVYVPCVPQRFVVCVLAFIGSTFSLLILLGGRNTVKEIKFDRSEQKSINRCFLHERGSHSSNFTDTRFSGLSWMSVMYSNDFKRACFGVASAVSSVASGLVVDSLGPRHIWAVGILLEAIPNSLIRLLYTVSPHLGLFILILAGLGFGTSRPGCSTLVAHWAAESERTFLIAIIESGRLFAYTIEFLILQHISSWGVRWDLIHYITCASSFVYVSLWYILFYDRPAQHPHMPVRELQFLKVTTVGVQGLSQPRGRKMPSVPWKKILLSPPVWSLQLINLASSWVHSLLYYQTNKYLLYVYNLHSIVIPGAYESGMALGLCFCSLILHAWIGDKLMSTRLTSRNANRRFFLTFSNYFTAGLFLIIPLIEFKIAYIVAVSYLLIAIQGMAVGPLMANPVDLSPRYAGLLQGLLSAGRALSIATCRTTVEFVVEDFSDGTSWAKIFHISAACLIVLSSPYLCFGSGEIQEWNYHCSEKVNENGETPLPQVSSQHRDTSLENP